MKTLTLEAYRLFFNLTGSQIFSYVAAIVLMTVCNLILLTGLCMLMDGALPLTHILKLFAFPQNLAIGVVIAIGLVLYAPFDLMDIAQNIPTKYVRLMAFFVAALAVLGYIFLVKYV